MTEQTANRPRKPAEGTLTYTPPVHHLESAPIPFAQERCMRYCVHPGCSAKVKRGRCSEHERIRHRADIQERGTAAERGYDRRWRRIRDRKIKLNPLCEPCEEGGRTTVADLVHHIVPLPDGTHEWDNLMSVCNPCHQSIHADLGRGNGHA